VITNEMDMCETVNHVIYKLSSGHDSLMNFVHMELFNSAKFISPLLKYHVRHLWPTFTGCS